MRRVAIVLLRVAFAAGLAACGAPTDATVFDASCPIPPVEQQCGGTCGNGQIDRCFSLPSSRCGEWPMRIEACDQGMSLECGPLGFYGGTAGCALLCTQFDETSCSACAPGITCDVVRDARAFNGIVADGTRFLFLDTQGAALVENGVVLRRISALVHSAVVVPGGWLLAVGLPSSLRWLDVDGNSTGSGPLGTPDAPHMVFGPGNRLFLAWNESDNQGRHVAVAVADTAGRIVVAGGKIFETTTPQPSVTTDGTSFFVAAGHTVARVTPEGAVTTNTTFPAIDDGPTAFTRITWDGTSGWYIGLGADLLHGVAQRFDGNGTPTSSTSSTQSRRSSPTATTS